MTSPLSPLPPVPTRRKDSIWRPWEAPIVVLVALGTPALYLALVGGVLTERTILFAVAIQYLAWAAMIVYMVRSKGTTLRAERLTMRATDVFFLFAGIGLRLGLGIALAPLLQRFVPDGGPPQESVQILLSPGGDVVIIAAFSIAAVILAPLFEEFTIRHMFLDSLNAVRKNTALALSAAFFTALHFFDLNGTGNLPQLLINLGILFIVGLFLGGQALKHDRLGPAIFTHAGFNLSGIVAVLLLERMSGL